MVEDGTSRIGRRWTRTVVMVLLLLAGGAIINVAVAWGSTFAAQMFGRATYKSVPISQPLSPRDTAWLEYADWRHVPMPEGHASQPALWSKHSSFAMEKHAFYIFHKQSIETGRGEHMLGGPMDLYCIRAGWPWYALEGGIRRSGPRSHNTQQGFDAVSLIRFDASPLALAIGLPLRPVVPGIIISSMFYAAILWLLIFAPSARRRFRRRRALCEKCAYPIGTSPVCTECGTPVVKKVQA